MLVQIQRKMGKIKDEIKKEIRNEVKDIIYEKAKQEVKDRVETKYRSIRSRIINFLGLAEPQSDKIYRISQEIKKTKNPVLDDQVLGIVELYTLNFGESLIELFGSTMSQSKDSKKS